MWDPDGRSVVLTRAFMTAEGGPVEAREGRSRHVILCGSSERAGGGAPGLLVEVMPGGEDTSRGQVARLTPTGDRDRMRGRT